MLNPATSVHVWPTCEVAWFLYGWLLGVIASAVIAIGLPLQVIEVLPGLVMWLPILVFELVFAVWLIIKGVATPEAR